LAGFRKPFADILLTVREVAAYLRVSTRTVYALCDQGHLAHVRVMNALRVEPAAVTALVRSQAGRERPAESRSRRPRVRPARENGDRR